MCLTLVEAEFAEKNHSLIYSFLNKRNLQESEYYDVVVFGYLDAVKDYFRKPSCKKYSFSTLAWRSMSLRVLHYKRFPSKQLCFPVFKNLPTEFEFNEKILFASLPKYLTDSDKELLLLRSYGFSYRAIAKQKKLSKSSVHRRLKKIAQQTKGWV